MNSSRHTDIRIPYIIDNNRKVMTVNAEITGIRSYHDIYPAVMSEDDPHNAYGEKVTFMTPGDAVWMKSSPSTFSRISFRDDLRQESIPEEGGLECLEVKVKWPAEQIGAYRMKADMYHVFIYGRDDIGEMMVFYADEVNMMDNLALPPEIIHGVRFQEYISLYLPVQWASDGERIYIVITPVTADGTMALDNTSAGSSYFMDESGERFVVLQEADPLSYSIKYHILYERSEFDSLYDRLRSRYFEDSHSTFLRVMIASRYNGSLVIDRIFKFNDADIITGDEYSISFNDIFAGMPAESLRGEGFVIMSSLEAYIGDVTVKDIENDEYEGLTLSLPSNSIPLTDNIIDMISAGSDNIILSLNGEIIKYIDNMSTTIRVPNIIQNTTISISNPAGAGSGVVKPVFVRAYPLESIVLHRDVKENILINLDTYLGKTDTFYLKACGVYFPEYSRLYDGVVFNVNGSLLNASSGTYYICDADKNLITTGKFTVE